MAAENQASRPDFSGIWKLIRGESQFGFLAPPRLRVDTIAHNVDSGDLRIRTRQQDASGDVTVDRDLVIGGDPVPVRIRGRERLVRASWADAGELLVETTSVVSGGDRRIEDRWRLDPKGEWLTVERVHDQPGGAVRQRLRFQRRPAAPVSGR